MSVGRGPVALLALAGLIVPLLLGALDHGTGHGTSATQPPAGARVGGSTLARSALRVLPQDVHVQAAAALPGSLRAGGHSVPTTTSNQGVCELALLAPGDAFTQTFDTPGVFPYICAVHRS